MTSREPRLTPLWYDVVTQALSREPSRHGWHRRVYDADEVDRLLRELERITQEQK